MSEAMMDRERALALCEQALEACAADEVMVHLSASSSALTRFANNHIHQNVAEEGANLSVRAFVGSRSGIATGNDISDAGIRDTARRAVELARLAEPDEAHMPLPEPVAIPKQVEGVPATADFGPAERAEAVRAVIAIAEEAEQTASGAFGISATVSAVATSSGVRACDETTSANLRTVIMAGDSSGFASAISRDVREIDAEAVARTAGEKAAASAGPISVEPGEWDVILEPEASATIVGYTAMLSFGALSVQEGRSAVGDRIGERVCGDNITVWDDAMDPRGMMSSFDYEGMPRRRVVLIERGVARGLVYDTKTAAKDGVATTGHATGPGGWGPMPGNIFVQTGDAAVEEMIASTERGLLVTRFHYTNVLSPRQTVLTGMTRDGTFLVENGRIVGGVRNLRFTENILEALGRVEMIGAEGKLTSMAWAPAMKIAGFTFSGSTEF
ncbi:MAG: TldD/PmbA family protein [Armatimonadetes bacterium]|nr:TldD/PmbA family protein [Armatimonadota bacterium]